MNLKSGVNMTFINVYHDEGFESLEEEDLERPINYSWEFIVLNRLEIIDELTTRLEDEDWTEGDIRFNLQDILEPVLKEIIDETEDNLIGDYK